MLGDRFNETSPCDAIGQFHSLKQTMSVTEYVENFEELMSLVKRSNPALSEAYFVSSFISGLKDFIQHHLQCYKPSTLSQAFWYAKRLEQANPTPKKPQFLIPNPKWQKPWVKDAKEKEQAQTTIADLRAAGKCFKCREPWIPGHAKVCKGKQAYSVILVENDEGKEEVAVVSDDTTSEDAEFHDAEPSPTVQISMHALSGISTQANTFTLKLQIGSQLAVALVDSGSDVSFINDKFAIKSGLAISPASEIKVSAANGKTMTSLTACQACSYSIQGHNFTSDFRLLGVQGFDIILGTDWIYTHSPVALDQKRMEMSITKEEQ